MMKIIITQIVSWRTKIISKTIFASSLIIISTNCYSLEKYIDSAYVDIPLSKFAKHKDNWQSKFNKIDIRFDERVLPDSGDSYYYKSEYIFKSLPSILVLTAKPISENRTKLLFNFESIKNKTIAKKWTSNIKYTLLQECGADIPNIYNINKKSHALYFSLTMINSGLGFYYSSYKTPTFPKEPWHSWVFAAADLGFTTVALTTNSKKDRNFCITFAVVYKCIALLRHFGISNHNDLVKTGYKFRVN